MIPIYEESIQVGKREVSHGRLRVRSYVVETAVNEQVSLRTESVSVDRRPVDRAVSATDAMFQDRVIEVEEFAEEAVVSKQARVVEEISLHKEARDRTETITDTVPSHRGRNRRTAAGPWVGGSTARSGIVEGSNAGTVMAHMDVIASDGTKVGTVDHMDGADTIKLAKTTSPDGEHHYIPMAWVDHIDQACAPQAHNGRSQGRLVRVNTPPRQDPAAADLSSLAWRKPRLIRLQAISMLLRISRESRLVRVCRGRGGQVLRQALRIGEGFIDDDPYHHGVLRRS